MPWFLAALLLLPLGPALAQPARPRPTPPAPIASPAPPPLAEAIAALPTMVDGWQRGAVTEFEARPGGTGLGSSVEYRPLAGGPGVATIYLYDRGRSDLPGGAEGPEVAAELATALRDIDSLGPVRRYRVDSRRPASAPPGLRCEALVLAFEGGNRADSLVCLGIARGRFVKLRLTVAAAAAEAAEAEAGKLGAAALAVAPSVAAAAPPPPRRAPSPASAAPSR